MSAWLGALLVLAGSLLCLIAALGVVRLPDFFMRMHAATKAGVAGSGLVLLGVAAIDGTLASWIKALLAVLFLLLTTPVAGHLIGRAGYVSGVPLWRGTREDQLAGVLARGSFDADAQDTGDCVPVGAVRRVVLGLAAGPNLDRAITEAIRLARTQEARLCGVAVIDSPRLLNVGPVPIGAGWHAQQMRERRVRQARAAAAGALQAFEAAAVRSGLDWDAQLVEGRPRKVLGAFCDEATCIVVAADSWFDQGVLDLRVDVAGRLAWPGARPPLVVR